MVFVLNLDYSLNIQSKPRTEYKMPDSFIGKKWRNVWLFRNSAFKDWIKDSDDILIQCFNQDWNNCKMHKIITDLKDYE